MKRDQEVELITARLEADCPLIGAKAGDVLSYCPRRRTLALGRELEEDNPIAWAILRGNGRMLSSPIPTAPPVPGWQ